VSVERVTVDGAVVRFALAADGIDGMDDDAWEQLARLGRTVRTVGASCVVLHGTPGVFCHGDLPAGPDGTDAPSAATPEERWRRVSALHAPAVRAVCGSEVPVVAAVRGTARDLGVTLAMAADVRVLGESTRFVVAGLDGPGALPAGLAWLLDRRAPSLVGPLVYGPGEVDAATAGVAAARVVPDDQLESQAMALARKLAARPGAARARRAALGRVTREDLEVALEFDAELSALRGGGQAPSEERQGGGGDARDVG